MKTSIVVRNGVSQQFVELITRLIDQIHWPSRCSAIGDVVMSILDGKPRVEEDFFGWDRTNVELGMNECRTKIVCFNDLSARKSPRAEEKDPKLLLGIVEIMTPESQAESSLQTTILYTDGIHIIAFCPKIVSTKPSSKNAVPFKQYHCALSLQVFFVNISDQILYDICIPFPTCVC